MSTFHGSAEALDSDEKGSRRANPIDIHVGSRVRFRRMLLGMSQEKL
ncbi:MAG TPA: transcriptional regulator, partial [Hyphomicrobiaceae bacterium]|nr:transcriptional regulator [Hyphomicrobiaceae bacterium]